MTDPPCLAFRISGLEGKMVKKCVRLIYKPTHPLVGKNPLGGSIPPASDGGGGAGCDPPFKCMYYIVLIAFSDQKVGQAPAHQLNS